MGRVFEDGFDHYGSNEGNMLDGTYAQVDNGSLQTAQFATGTHSFLMNGNTGLTTFDGLRKVLPIPLDKLGMTCRVYLPSLPSQPYSLGLAHFMTSNPSDSTQLSFIIGANGEIHIIRDYWTAGSSATSVGGTLLASTDPVLVTTAWQHVEIQAYIHDTAGWVRIAVDGQEVYEGTGLDTKRNSTKVCSIGQSRTYISASGSFYIDDYIIYDFTGDSAVDTDFCPTTDVDGVATNFIGELQVWPLFTNGDTAEADWLKSTGTTGYPLINEADPDDVDYIYSLTAGDLSEFDLEDLPPEITYIRGLGIHQRLSKSDSGVAMTKVGMKSVAATDDAAERPVTVEPTYWRDAIDVDPNSGARWTRTSLNAAKLRLTRSV